MWNGPLMIFRINKSSGEWIIYLVFIRYYYVGIYPRCVISDYIQINLYYLLPFNNIADFISPFERSALHGTLSLSLGQLVVIYSYSSAGLYLHIPTYYIPIRPYLYIKPKYALQYGLLSLFSL